MTANSVTVWVAMRSPANSPTKLTLDVFLNGTQIFTSGKTDLVQVGSKLALGCVTAYAGPAQALTSGKIYEYDLRFGDSDVNLADLAPEVIFDGASRPSFALPGPRKDLVIVTGSCRKPHGPGNDALALLHDKIESTLDDPAKRPQLLLLTGDQIYADDVAGALLHLILDAEETLIGSDESLPAWGRIRDLKPSHRGRIGDPRFVDGDRIGFFTSEHSDSHLLSLSEYLLMYLFAWSPVLWTGNQTELILPTFEEATGDPSHASGEPRIYPYHASAAQTPNPKATQFTSECARLKSFHDDLPRVRRALANIPSLMMFDDHEVTDDWNINGWWCDRTLRYDDARQVMTNGLTAFALCQAWGNTPERFEPGRWGNEVVTAVRGGATSDDMDILDNALLPPRNAPFKNGGTLSTPVSVGDRWAFDLVYEDFHLIAMDTRTARRFPDVENGPAHKAIGFPELIGPTELLEQVPPFQKPMAVVLFPPPLMGWPIIESAQAGRSGAARFRDDCEAPGLRPEFLERTLTAFARSAPLSNGKKRALVSVLSGDIHFTFGALIRYESTRGFEEPNPPTPSELIILSLTSSALKNRPKTVDRLGLTLIGINRLAGSTTADRTVVGDNSRAAFEPRSWVLPLGANMSDAEKWALSFCDMRRINLEPAGWRSVVLRDSDLNFIPYSWRYAVEMLFDPAGHGFVLSDNSFATLTFSSGGTLRFQASMQRLRLESDVSSVLS
ncbi:MAG: hypothetical protein JJ863_17730 [Deltaproteobacteria bacterium]|nr:hypothetical protein [Deltaproteobacteria bacterium]